MPAVAAAIAAGILSRIGLAIKGIGRHKRKHLVGLRRSARTHGFAAPLARSLVGSGFLSFRTIVTGRLPTLVTGGG